MAYQIVGLRYAGAEVTPFYDSLLEKITAWAPTPEEAVARMERALREFRIRGVKTNLLFLEGLLAHPRFRAGDITTRCEASLRRLRLDTIDLWQLHRIDPEIPLESSSAPSASFATRGRSASWGFRRSSSTTWPVPAGWSTSRRSRTASTSLTMRPAMS